MRLSDPRSPRKGARLGLLAPLLALAAAAAAWSGGWLWMAGGIAHRMDQARGAWAAKGGEFSWTSRKIHGFPFRLDIDLTGARLGDASGWAIAAPSIEAEAFVFAPGHWVAVAPDGVVLWRRSGGPVIVKAKVLRASLSDFAAHPPRLSVEGIALGFATPRGGRPFFVERANELEIHTRAGPGDEGALALELQGAKARLGGLAARIAQGRPLDLTAEISWSHASALSGTDWPSAAAAWSAAGGTASVHRIAIAAGGARLDATAGTLTVGADGRLEGALTASLGQAPRALATLGEAGAVAPETAATAASVLGALGQAPTVTVTIDFQAGQTTLGPVAIGPAPRVY